MSPKKTSLVFHALIESKWPADIKRLQEQKDILEGILQERDL